MNKDLLRKLTEAVGATAFKLFKNERFRKLIFFDSITQLEQDRIFNELVLAVLTVIMLTCDAPDIPEENKVFFKDQG